MDVLRFVGCICDQICQIEAFEEVMEDDCVQVMWIDPYGY